MGTYALNFPITAGDPGPLRNIASAAQQIAQQTKLSAGEVKLWNAAMKQATDSGLSYKNALNENIAAFAKMGGSARAYALELRDVIAAQEKAAASAERLSQQQARAAQSLASRSLGGPSIPAGLGGFGTVATALGVGAGITAGIAELVKSTSEAARATVNLSNELGVTASKAREFETIARITGVGVSAFATGERMLSQALEDQTGRGKNAAEALQRLGVSMIDSNGSVREAGTVYQELLQRLAAIPSPTERAREATDIFGRGAVTSILPMVAAYKDATAQIERFGLTLDSAVIERAARAAAGIAAMGAAWDNAKTRILAGFPGAPQRRLGRAQTPEDLMYGTPNSVGAAAPLMFGPGSAESISAHAAEIAAREADSKRFSSFLDVQGETEEVLRQRVTNSKKSYEDELAKGKEFLGSGVSDDARDKERKQITDLRAAYDSANASLQALIKTKETNNKIATQAQELKARVAEYEGQQLPPEELDRLNEMAAGNPRLFQSLFEADTQNPVWKIAGRMAEDDVKYAGQPEATRSRLHDIGAAQIAEELQKQQTVAAKDALERDNFSAKAQGRPTEDLNRDLRQSNENRYADIKKQAEEAKKLQEEYDRTTQISTQSRVYALQRNASRQGRISDLTIDDPQAAAEAALKNRLTLAQQVYSIEKASASSLATAKDREIAQAEAESKLQKETDDARLDTEVKILELRKSASEQLSSDFAGGIESLMHTWMTRIPGQHESHGTMIEQLARQSALGLSDTLIKNVSSQFLFNKGNGLLDNVLPNFQGTFLGPLTKGMLLFNRPRAGAPTIADDAANLPSGYPALHPTLDELGAGKTGDASQSIAANTDATTTNTNAINDLTNTLEYLASGGTEGSLPGGVSLPTSANGLAIGLIPGFAGLGLPAALQQTSGYGSIGSIPSIGTFGASPASVSLGGMFDAIAGQGTNPSVTSSISFPGIGSDVPATDQNYSTSGRITFPQISNSYTDVGAPTSSYAGAIADLTSSSSIPPGSDLAAIAMGGGGTGLPSILAQTGGVGDMSAIAPITRSATATAGDIATTADSISKSLKSVSGFAAVMANPFGDISGAPPGFPKTPGISGIGIAGAGADIALGGVAAYQQFSRGGVSGDLGGASSVLGLAAALDPEPISKLVLGLAAIGTGFFSALTGRQTKAQRDAQIQGTLFNSQYLAPQAINLNSSTSGGYADFGANGALRTSDLSPYPKLSQAYLDVPYRFAVPGQQLSQFGGGAPPVTVNHNYAPGAFQSLDASGMQGLMTKNSGILADAVAHGLESGPTRLTQALRMQSGNG